MHNSARAIDVGVFPEPPMVIFPMHTIGTSKLSYLPVISRNLEPSSHIRASGVIILEIRKEDFPFENQNLGAFNMVDIF